MLTGLTSGTATNLQFGAGAVLKSKYTQGTTLSPANVLTATNGGITFSATPRFFTPTVDGAGENVKGMRYITGWDVTLLFTAVETSLDVIKTALGCSVTGSGVVSGGSTIASTDYKDFYMIAERGDGSIVQITIKNGLNTNGLSLQTANNGNGGISFTIVGHYDPSSVNSAPFEIEEISAPTSSGSGGDSQGE